ncbi:hypothetical protein MKY37_20375 [Psychrobacillus sp. FSL K6-2836]|uniref:hypothetical protein n=1 Tax=Psychrobacillus sp. FSL K6-2836 TaxID=2921548 RepID=UPI0030F76033
MKYWIVILSSIFVIIAGCSNDYKENNNVVDVDRSVTYEAIVIINGAEYHFVGPENKDEYTLGEAIGKVKKRVPLEVGPSENFVSNYLNEGTLIFSVIEDSEIYLAETEDSVYEIFRKVVTD